MISDALRIDIEVWAAKRHSHPFLKLAFDGRMTRAMVTSYIANLTHMIRLTPAFLHRAIDGARKKNDPKLVAHYGHKMEEEVGHAAWGDSDLASLTKKTTTTSSPPESSTKVAVAAHAEPANETTIFESTDALADFINATIDEEPSNFLVYLAFTEYATVITGDEFIQAIEQRCGIPASSLSIIGNHVELDRDHAEEGFGLIDDLVGEPERLAPMRAVLAGLIERYERVFMDVITKLPARGSDEANVAATESAARVSAA